MKLLIVLLALTAVMSVSGMNEQCRCECPKSNEYVIDALDASEEYNSRPFTPQDQYPPEHRISYRFGQDGRASYQ